MKENAYETDVFSIIMVSILMGVCSIGLSIMYNDVSILSEYCVVALIINVIGFAVDKFRNHKN